MIRAVSSTMLFCFEWQRTVSGCHRVMATSSCGRQVSQWARALMFKSVSPMCHHCNCRVPVSPHVAKKLFGEIALTLGYYQCVELQLNDIPVVLTRTGWSGELGYEIYLARPNARRRALGPHYGGRKEYGILPACPSLMRSVEGGILSHGSDITPCDSPFTIGLERLMDLDKPSEFIGRDALKRIEQEGTPRKLVGANFGRRGHWWER
jgi:glycine cleavage system aminomethyltransferase T